MRIRSARSPYLGTAALLLVTLVAGCGGDEGGGLLSAAQLKDALITADDLGTGYVVDEDDDDDDSDDPSLGCLDALDDLDGVTEPEREEEITFEAGTELALPGVFSVVGTFEDAAATQRGLDQIAEAVEGCSAIDETDEDGFRLQLDVRSDTETQGRADGQVSIDATGTASGEGFEFPFGVRFTAIRVDNHIVVVGFVNAARDISADADAVSERALARLDAVASGTDLPSFEPLDLTEPDLRELVTGNA